MLGLRFIKMQPTSDFVAFNSGTQATITVAEKRGHLVI
jgi:hypothetical protein